MKWAIVGFPVGFDVGKSSQPDKPQPNVINDLSSFCRKCRVPTQERRPENLKHFGPKGGLE